MGSKLSDLADAVLLGNSRLKRFVRRIPVVGPVARRLFRSWATRPRADFDSEAYWRRRYEAGGNSGDGSYGQLAAFKADVLNTFVREHGIRTLIEYGCGDGNQLKLAEYPSYTGFDVSPEALDRCERIFARDDTKVFKSVDDYAGERAELTLSLDVLFHLVEDRVFDQYLQRLFDSSDRFVIVYSSDTDHNPAVQSSQVKHRKFTRWVEQNRPQFTLRKHIPNRYPYRDGAGAGPGSFADFYVFERLDP